MYIYILCNGSYYRTPRVTIDFDSCVPCIGTYKEWQVAPSQWFKVLVVGSILVDCDHRVVSWTCEEDCRFRNTRDLLDYFEKNERVVADHQDLDPDINELLLTARNIFFKLQPNELQINQLELNEKQTNQSESYELQIHQSEPNEKQINQSDPNKKQTKVTDEIIKLIQLYILPKIKFQQEHMHKLNKTHDRTEKAMNNIDKNIESNVKLKENPEENLLRLRFEFFKAQDLENILKAEGIDEHFLQSLLKHTLNDITRLEKKLHYSSNTIHVSENPLTPALDPPTPATETLTPAIDTPIPAVNTPIPAVDPSTPALDPPTQAVDPPTPAVDPHTSAVDTPTPAVNPSTPALDPPTQAVDPPTPAVDPHTPAVDTPTPALDPTTPAVGTPTPALDPPTADLDPPTPALDPPTPAVDTPTPAVDLPTPAVDPPTPAVDTPTPAVDTPTPVDNDDKETTNLTTELEMKKTVRDEILQAMKTIKDKQQANPSCFEFISHRKVTEITRDCHARILQYIEGTKDLEGITRTINLQMDIKVRLATMRQGIMLTCAEIGRDGVSCGQERRKRWMKRCDYDHIMIVRQVDWLTLRDKVRICLELNKSSLKTKHDTFCAMMKVKCEEYAIRHRAFSQPDFDKHDETSNLTGQSPTWFRSDCELMCQKMMKHTKRMADILEEEIVDTVDFGKDFHQNVYICYEEQLSEEVIPILTEAYEQIFQKTSLNLRSWIKQHSKTELEYIGITIKKLFPNFEFKKAVRSMICANRIRSGLTRSGLEDLILKAKQAEIQNETIAGECTSMQAKNKEQPLDEQCTSIQAKNKGQPLDEQCTSIQATNKEEPLDEQCKSIQVKNKGQPLDEPCTSMQAKHKEQTLDEPGKSTQPKNYEEPLDKQCTSSKTGFQGETKTANSVSKEKLTKESCKILETFGQFFTMMRIESKTLSIFGKLRTITNAVNFAADTASKIYLKKDPGFVLGPDDFLDICVLLLCEMDTNDLQKLYAHIDMVSHLLPQFLQGGMQENSLFTMLGTFQHLFERKDMHDSGTYLHGVTANTTI